jgi:hypothetical protein
MAKKNTIGIDPSYVKKLDFSLAIKRISQDSKSDFIYAPHLSFIYTRAATELATRLASDLQSGTFAPGLPISIEVPKSARMKMSGKRGPSFSRPGSILLPKDRLLYQLLADAAAPIIDGKTDKERSFSHQLADAKSESMFLPTRTCWSGFQKSLKKHAENKNLHYVVKLDIANCFGTLNQHMLINVLKSTGYPNELSGSLEELIGHFTGTRSSRGIVQGIFPSDLLGNFYLDPVDRFLKDNKHPSARYVDDIYVFVDTGDSADRVVRGLISLLRQYDLSLNETKSRVMAKSALQAEEPDLEVLFQAAIEEIAAQTDDEDLDVDYGFQAEFEDEDEDEDEDDDGDNVDLELEATKHLFDSLEDYEGHEETIERFCLPLFSKSESDHAVAYVLNNFNKRPAMAQIYVTYLSRFLDDLIYEVEDFLVGALEDDSLVDWQKMWVLAGLLQAKSYKDDTVKVVWDVFSDANRHEALRAVAAIFVGRYGDHARRTNLINAYGPVGSPYIQSAIYFSSRWFPGAERANARKTWGNLTELNEMMTAALQNYAASKT